MNNNDLDRHITGNWGEDSLSDEVPITPIQIITTHREIHMMGDMVAVCWNLETREKKITIAGIEYIGLEQTRSGNPYIDFVWIRQDNQTDEPYEDEDSPVDGGIDTETAQQLIDELTIAIQYLEQIDNAK